MTDDSATQLLNNRDPVQATKVCDETKKLHTGITVSSSILSTGRLAFVDCFVPGRGVRTHFRPCPVQGRQKLFIFEANVIDGSLRTLMQ